MRKLILLMVGLTVTVGAYALWPVFSAFQIKQAVKAGDVATLERKVLWAPVRASLKASIATLGPVPDAAKLSTRTGFSIWSSLKATAAPMLADSFIDRYVTPEGISQIQLARRGGWRALFGMTPRVPDSPASSMVSNALQSGDTTNSAESETNAIIRFIAFYQRVVRAKFHSLSHVEFEIVDKGTPGRSYISQFELTNFDWKLASVRVIGVGF